MKVQVVKDLATDVSQFVVANQTISGFEKSIFAYCVKAVIATLILQKEYKDILLYMTSEIAMYIVSMVQSTPGEDTATYVYNAAYKKMVTSFQANAITIQFI